MRGGALALAFVIAATAGAGTLAQAPALRFTAAPPDEAILELMARARDDLPRINDSRGRPFPVSAPGDRDGAVIPLAEASSIVDAGFASGAARWCRLDWQQNLRFLLNEQRLRGSWTERQIAFIGVLHAHAMSAVMDANRGRTCAASDRLIVGDYLRRRWH